eukprot:5381887-Pyramimonas_sp.AAC.1
MVASLLWEAELQRDTRVAVDDGQRGGEAVGRVLCLVAVVLQEVVVYLHDRHLWFLVREKVDSAMGCSISLSEHALQAPGLELRAGELMLPHGLRV